MRKLSGMNANAKCSVFRHKIEIAPVVHAGAAELQISPSVALVRTLAASGG